MPKAKVEFPIGNAICLMATQECIPNAILQREPGFEVMPGIGFSKRLTNGQKILLG